MQRAVSIWLAGSAAVFLALTVWAAGPEKVAPSLADPDLSSDAARIILLNPGIGTNTPLDVQIAQTQAKIKTGPNRGAQVERLGWLFVDKARVSNDPGYYKLAEECAVCLENGNTNSPDALLLRGHVLHSLHHFKEAEPIALKLTQQRGLAYDFGLLGDVEYDQGKIPEAVAAYQEMVNRRPDLESYSRVAQARWITGDVTGAIEAMTLAVEAGSPIDAEPTAWTYARLATLQLQNGDLAAARISALRALQIQSNSAPALFALGRIQLAAGETDGAIESLTRAAALNHLPEAQWLLADALRGAGKTSQANEVEAALMKRGAAEDPRSFALYLATRGENLGEALLLAEREFDTRGDVFTHDALAWALFMNGKIPEARAEMAKALAWGTQDGRLYFHATLIIRAAGETEEASRCEHLALSMKQMLYPSELKQLDSPSFHTEFSQQNTSSLKTN